MILRRLATSIRKQDWFAVVIETLIVVMGVFLGLQVNNWNEARDAEARRQAIVEALITDLQDANYVIQDVAAPTIESGLADWRTGFERGEMPVPFYFRVDGSDTPPDTWSVLQQMNIDGLFDPVTVFDLNMYYSEMKGVGLKYVRYVTFVEDEILPYETGDPQYFYTEDGSDLQPRFHANMARLTEWRGEILRLGRWADCLTERLRNDIRAAQSCLRAHPEISEESLLVRPAQEDAP